MTTPAAWDLTLDRADLRSVRVDPAPVPEPADGEAVLRVERVGVTANNVTYAVLGEALRYWEFFPAAEGRGRVPLWGFAEVVASRADGVAVGDRVYGYLPTSSHLLVQPSHVRDGGFRDASPHRAVLPAVYNSYAAAEPALPDLQVLYRPLFLTAFVLADWLTDTGPAVERVVLSSASSKTAYATAWFLRDAPVEVVGLTSPGNAAFTRGLGVYDAVLTYDDVAQLPVAPTAYVDVAGSVPLRQALHRHLGERLVRDVVVGIAQGEAFADAGPLAGARPAMFFAPDQIAKRAQDWGPGGVESRAAAAWDAFAPQAAQWVDVVEGGGPEGLRDAWLAVHAGVGPRVGHVVLLS